MSLESILGHILGEARAKEKEIIQQAQERKAAILRQAQDEAEKIYQEEISTAEALLESERQRLIVQARLGAKMNLLKAKQELIDAVFAKLKSELGNKERFKKQQIFPDKAQEAPENLNFYLGRIRLDYESEIAKILWE